MPALRPPPAATAARHRLFRRRRYPIWNVTAVLLTIVFVAIAAGSVTFLVSPWPWLVEAEITLGIVAACLFAFLAVGLYRGVRLKRERLDPGAALSTPDLGHLDPTGLNGADLLAGGADDPGGWIVGVVLGLVLTLLVGLLLLLLVYVVVPVAWALTMIVLLGAWWIAYLALRRVFVLSRRCRGNLGPSLGYAAYYTLLYVGWLFGVLLAWEHFVRP